MFLLESPSPPAQYATRPYFSYAKQLGKWLGEAELKIKEWSESAVSGAAGAGGAHCVLLKSQKDACDGCVQRIAAVGVMPSVWRCGRVACRRGGGAAAAVAALCY